MSEPAFDELLRRLIALNPDNVRRLAEVQGLEGVPSFEDLDTASE